jgi:putative ABC transport system ATP-binding protein
MTVPTAHDRTPALLLRGVTKRYGAGPTEVRAIEDVTLEVPPGELVAVMGPSGSGKSTLLHLAAGLERPSTGEIRVAGVELGSLRAPGLAELRRRHVGVVFQRLNLVPTLTALENVTLPLELDGTPLRRARAEAEAMLGEVGIDGPLDRYPDDLSGGQQQRVAIARALVGERSLLLCDEPTGALDSVTADRVIDLLSRMVAERSCACVLITHEARFAAWADRIVRVRDGELVEDARLERSGRVAAVGSAAGTGTAS